MTPRMEEDVVEDKQVDSDAWGKTRIPVLTGNGTSVVWSESPTQHLILGQFHYYSYWWSCKQSHRSTSKLNASPLTGSVALTT